MSRRPSLRHRLEYILVRTARALDRLLGPRLSGGLAARLGRLAYRPLGFRARLVEDQLRAAFPDRDEAWVRRTAAAAYAHLGREGMMLLRLSRLGRDEVIAATEVEEGLDELRRAIDAGTGAVVVTGHFGNWEIGGAALAARGVPIDVVAQPQTNPLFDRLLNRARERLGMRIIKRGSAPRAGVRALREGRVIALVADQNARRGGLFVPFFGRPASTFRGPAVLALRSGAPVFIGTAVRRPDGRYGIRIRRIAVPGPGEAESRARALTAAHVAALEAAVREAPEQYFWHHRRWKTRPPPGPRPGGAGAGVEGNGPGAGAV